MPATPHPTRDVRRLPRTGQFVRALLAVVLLAALVAGLPWGLVHYVGWPLPHAVPSWGSVTSTLTSPMEPGFLVDMMACILWPAWGVFALDVVRATAEAARGISLPARPTAGPLQSLAATLVGTVLLMLLPLRGTAPAAEPAAAVPRATATAPAASGTPLAATSISGRNGLGRVEVQAPHNGVYDSLWRIADRALGDGARWPEIYALNRGRPQPDGRTLIDPGLIRPGWVLRLPGAATHRAEPHRPSVTPHAPRHPASPPTAAPTGSPARPTAPGTPSPSQVPTHAAPRVEAPHGEPGLSLPTGAFVGAGLAAVVAGALLAARRRHRIRYRPGSGDRDDLAIAPVVRALRIAYDQTAEEGEPFPTAPGQPTDTPPVFTHTVGIREGHALAWDLAGTRGLGLIGPGALDAARALLVGLLAEHPVRIIVPAADAGVLLGRRATERDHPADLHLVDDLDTALDTLEAELLGRARAHAEPHPGISPEEPATADQKIVLVATPADAAARRLQAVLDNGSTLGVAGVLLGQWRPGGTLRIRPDGTVAAVSPSLAPEFAGARLFHLPAADAEALLDLLADAGPSTTPRSTSVPARGVHQARAASSPLLDSGLLPPRPRPVRRRLGPGLERDDSDPTDGGAGDDAPNSGAAVAVRVEPPTDSAPPTPSPRAQSPVQAEPPSPAALELAVMGRIRLTHHLPDGETHADLTTSLAPKHREVLTYLALHRDGARREALAGAIWPDAPRSRPYNSFHATLSQLRRALRTATHDEHTDITLHTDGHYALDHTRTSVDLWDLQEALRATHRDDGDQTAALERALALYQGDLAREITTEWIEAPRESLRRDMLDAIGTAVRDVREARPEQALLLLEHARGLDPYNEAVYRGIGRLQARLGRRDAVPRTLGLLVAALAEIDEQPAPETITLFESLRLPPSTAAPGSGRAAS